MNCLCCSLSHDRMAPTIILRTQRTQCTQPIARYDTGSESGWQLVCT